MKRQHKCHANKYPDDNPIILLYTDKKENWGLLIRENVFLNIDFCPHCGRKLEMDIKEAIKIIEENKLFLQYEQEAWEVIKERCLVEK